MSKFTNFKGNINASIHQSLLKDSFRSNGKTALYGLGLGSFIGIPAGIIAQKDYEDWSDPTSTGVLTAGSILATSVGLSFGKRELGKLYSQGFYNNFAKTPLYQTRKNGPTNVMQAFLDIDKPKYTVPTPSEIEPQFFNFKNFKNTSINSDEKSNVSTVAGEYLSKSNYTNNSNDFYKMVETKYTK